jgi:hypothetical protein
MTSTPALGSSEFLGVGPAIRLHLVLRLETVELSLIYFPGAGLSYIIKQSTDFTCIFIRH